MMPLIVFILSGLQTLMFVTLQPLLIQSVERGYYECNFCWQP